ncbi:hypothetical protein EC9_39830 [Rosistilla ulvae]|uniref:Uncharacterized protein n=1 Tax=Rosistilla ulvae TaxID=1930277 RepID=A0A517M4I3_9BACT|nr:hypothetical protein EC9_39830 [Rosistilla ulvae]
MDAVVTPVPLQSQAFASLSQGDSVHQLEVSAGRYGAAADLRRHNNGFTLMLSQWVFQAVDSQLFDRLVQRRFATFDPVGTVVDAARCRPHM